MKVYIACPSFYHPFASAVAQAMRGEGIEVVSTWQDQTEVRQNLPLGEARIAWQKNMYDLDSAELLLVITYETHGRETYVELGYAIGRGLPVVWLDRGGGECLALSGYPGVLTGMRHAYLSEVLRLLKFGKSGG